MWLETLRMHGAAPFQSLTNLEPMKLAGRTVPAGTRFWLHYRYIMNNSPEMKEKLRLLLRNLNQVTIVQKPH